jgi:hypothetical protein
MHGCCLLARVSCIGVCQQLASHHTRNVASILLGMDHHRAWKGKWPAGRIPFRCAGLGSMMRWTRNRHGFIPSSSSLASHCLSPRVSGPATHDTRRPPWIDRVVCAHGHTARAQDDDTLVSVSVRPAHMVRQAPGST